MSKAKELLNILNTTLKKEIALPADDEVYRSGFWPTGDLPIDATLGGGWAKGRMGLIYGESATLKSKIALGTAAQVQKLGGTAAYIDVEHSFDQDWSEQLGVNNSDLILSQPTTGEEVIDAAEVLVRNDIDYIAIDSIAALLPRSEHELMLSGKDNNQPANIARLMALGLRKLNSANQKTTILWVSQMRDNIGGMAFAPKSNVTGGKAKHYYVSQELVLRKIGKIYQEYKYYNGEKEETGKQVIAQQFLSELTKSRFGQPFIQQHFVFGLQDHQIDLTQFLIQQGLMDGYITKAGAWWTYVVVDKEGVVVNEFKAGSKDKFYQLISGEESARSELLKAVCNKYGLSVENY